MTRVTRDISLCNKDNIKSAVALMDNFKGFSPSPGWQGKLVYIYTVSVLTGSEHVLIELENEEDINSLYAELLKPIEVEEVREEPPKKGFLNSLFKLIDPSHSQDHK
jgi:hypothetical protein